MANGFGSFYVGSSGLKNSQNALNTTANNMANVNTTGYVRQQVRFSDKHYITRNNQRAPTSSRADWVFPYRMWHMSGIYS